MRMCVSLIWHQPRAHDVSILMTVVAGDGLCLGASPRAKTSMTIMRPPQQGHGRLSRRDCSGSGVAAAWGSVSGIAMASSSRALAMLSARLRGQVVENDRAFFRRDLHTV